MAIIEHEWQESVTQKELSEAAIVAIRTSDNILDEEDWPVYMLRFDEKGICIQQTSKSMGAYEIDDFIGKNLDDLKKWCNYDMTGIFGELSHDICILMYF